MRGVEREQPVERRSARAEIHPVAVREDPLEEALADAAIAKAVLVLEWQQGQVCREGAREGPHAPARRPPGRRMNPDPLETAARRLALEHVPGEGEVSELGGPAAGEPGHRRGVIDPAPGSDQSRGYRVALEPDGLPRDTEPELDLRTDGNPLDARSECLQEIPRALVPAVPADLPTEEARADPDAGPARERGLPSGHLAH